MGPESIMRSDSSESPMKGGMLCTADINGGDPCSLCLSVTNSDGARLLPCKEGRHTMFVAVPESQWAFEQQREKEKTLWERVDLGKSLPRVEASVRKVLSRLWSAKELKMGLCMLSRTLEGPEKRTPLGSCTAKSVLVDTPELCHQRGACSWILFKPKNSDQSEGGKCVDRYVFGAASKMDTLMSVEPGPAVDWYGRVLADVRVDMKSLRESWQRQPVQRANQRCTRCRGHPLLRISAHEQSSSMCNRRELSPLDDDGKEDFEAAAKNPSA